jgi:hypothetical protein
MTKKSISKCIGRKVIVADPISVPSESGRIRLGNIKDVRYEIAKVYREARSGLIPTQEATRLVYMLISLGNMIKDTEFEERIIKLEKLNDKS